MRLLLALLAPLPFRRFAAAAVAAAVAAAAAAAAAVAAAAAAAATLRHGLRLVVRLQVDVVRPRQVDGNQLPHLRGSRESKG